MRKTLQRPPVAAGPNGLDVRQRIERETGARTRRPVHAWVVAAIVGFVLATLTLAVLLSGDGPVTEEVIEPVIAQRDLAPTLRPGETDVIVLDMAGLGTAATGGEAAAPVRRPGGSMTPQ